MRTFISLLSQFPEGLNVLLVLRVFSLFNLQGTSRSLAPAEPYFTTLPPACQALFSPFANFFASGFRALFQALSANFVILSRCQRFVKSFFRLSQKSLDCSAASAAPLDWRSIILANTSSNVNPFFHLFSIFSRIPFHTLFSLRNRLSCGTLIAHYISM